MEGNSYPSDFAYKLAKFQSFTKNVIEVFPDGDRGVYRTNSRVRFTLPSASTIDLSDIALSFTAKAKFDSINDYTATPKTGIGEILFPRNIEQLIRQLTIYSNGKIIQQINDYDTLVSLMNDWKEQNEHSKVLSNATPTVSARTTATFSPIVQDQEFVIKDWLGLMGKSASANILDTNVLGTVIIEILFSASDCLIANVATNATFKDAGTGLGGASETVASKISGVDFEVSNLKLSMTRMSMPEEYYSMIQRVLSSGKRRILFDHYEIIEGSPANTGANSVRFNMNSQSINWMIGYMAQSNRKSDGKPKLWDSVSNQSSYYKRDGSTFSTGSYTVGSTKLPVNPMTNVDCYTNTLRLWGCKGDHKSHTNPRIDTLDKYKTSFHTIPLSLEYSQGSYDRDVKLMSGLDTNNLPVAITFEANLTGATNLTPVVVVNTSRILEFSDNQVVDVVM